MEMKSKGIFLGIDPGTTHLGIAVLDTCNGKPECTLFQVMMERSDDPVTRTVGTFKLLSRCINWYCYPMYACIEGASFGDRYRQVELAEVRAAAMIWCDSHEFKTRVMPPLFIRKEVFGDGKTKGRNMWKGIPPDCADALGCTYFSMVRIGE